MPNVLDSLMLDHRLQDASTNATPVAIPVDGTPVYTGDIDLSVLGDFEARLADVVLWIKLPLQTLALLPNTKTLTVDVCHGDAAEPTVILMGAVLVQTGVTGTDPAVPVSIKVRLPNKTKQFIRCKITASSSEAKVGNLVAGLAY